MISIQEILSTAFSSAIAQAFGPEFSQADPQVRIAGNLAFGDFQANAAMGLSAKLGKAPRMIAGEIQASLNLAGIAASLEIAGPGFINIKLESSFLSNRLAAFAGNERHGIPLPVTSQKTVIDYSSPNVAKEMHVGHLRSTIIGDAIARVLQAVGNNVLRQNHLGDWGTQFGMLIEHISDLGWDAGSEHSISDLNQLYKDAKAKDDADPSFAARARRRVVALQAGDPQTLLLWNLLIAESKHHFQSVYATLGVLLEDADYCGESFYNPMLAPLVQELTDSGQATVSDGALCAFPDGFTGLEDKPAPLILRKSDGGYGYDTTDMAAIQYRIRSLAAERLIYVTDARQRQHFAMVFKAAAEAGWLGESHRAEHVFFGSVMGEDGKPFKSRSGDTVKLADLLDEAIARALAIVESKNPNLPATEKSEIARVIGIGAVKYADLSNDRVKDYVFSWERMLSFDGNTAPYLQNAYVRIQSIFRKAGLAPETLLDSDVDFEFAETAERALALKLLQYPDAIAGVARSLEPHRLCNYLYDLATAYHQFYEKCPVLIAETETLKLSRLRMSALCATILKAGLSLLGIEVIQRM